MQVRFHSGTFCRPLDVAGRRKEGGSPQLQSVPENDFCEVNHSCFWFMPRLVRVQALCDSCRCAKASLYCAVHKENKCLSCDRKIHAEAALREHVRVPLDSVVTTLTVCQKCDQVPASVRFRKCSPFFSPLPITFRYKTLGFLTSFSTLASPSEIRPSHSQVYCESGCGVICSSCDARVISRSTRRHLHRALRDVIATRPITFSGPLTSVLDAGTTVEPSADLPPPSLTYQAQGEDKLSCVDNDISINSTGLQTTKSLVAAEELTTTLEDGRGVDGRKRVSIPNLDLFRHNVIDRSVSFSQTTHTALSHLQAIDETSSNAEHRNLLELLWPSDNVFFQDFEQAFDYDVEPDDLIDSRIQVFEQREM